MIVQSTIDDWIENVGKNQKPEYPRDMEKSLKLQRIPAEVLNEEEGVFDVKPSGVLKKYLDDYKLYEKYQIDLPKKIAEEMIMNGEFRVDAEKYHVIVQHSVTGKTKVISVNIYKTWDIGIDRYLIEELEAEMEDRLIAGKVPQLERPLHTRILDQLKAYSRKRRRE